MCNSADEDLRTQEILLAASNRELDRLRQLLRTTSANVQDSETGYTPLHSAILALAPDEASPQPQQQPNGTLPDHDRTAEPELQKQMEAAKETLNLLLQGGAIWNVLDRNNGTPGCVAYRLGLTELYEVMVDAGVRAEMLLNRLDGYEPLEEGSSDADAQDVNNENGVTSVEEGNAPASGSTENAQFEEERPTDENASPVDVKSEDYLRSTLTILHDRIIDDDSNGVMMSWETGIMKRSAELLCPRPGLRVLNIGHGMGIIDDCFQSHRPASHHIVEAHPTVLARIKDNGWHEKPNVVIHQERWQVVLPRLLEENVVFDAIYFDTFAEDYGVFRDFFSEYVIGLLDPAGGVEGEGGRWGFFNGLGADRQICYDVYTKVRESPRRSCVLKDRSTDNHSRL